MIGRRCCRRSTALWQSQLTMPTSLKGELLLSWTGSGHLLIGLRERPKCRCWFATPLPSYAGLVASGVTVSRPWRRCMGSSIKKLLSTRPGPFWGPVENLSRRRRGAAHLTATCTTMARRGNPLGRGRGRPCELTMAGYVATKLNAGLRASRQRASRRTRRTLPSGRRHWPLPPPAALARERRVGAGIQSSRPSRMASCHLMMLNC